MFGKNAINLGFFSILALPFAAGADRPVSNLDSWAGLEQERMSRLLQQSQTNQVQAPTMKDPLTKPETTPTTTGETMVGVWRRTGYRQSRWPMLADFRSRSFHLQQHQPVDRKRFSMLRD
jgi:hypothetical protein